MLGPLPPFPIKSSESGVRHEKPVNNLEPKYIRGDRYLLPLVSSEGLLVMDMHADETEVEMTREEMEARFEELKAWMKERALGESDFENRCGEYFILKSRLEEK